MAPRATKLETHCNAASTTSASLPMATPQRRLCIVHVHRGLAARSAAPALQHSVTMPPWCAPPSTFLLRHATLQLPCALQMPSVSALETRCSAGTTSWVSPWLAALPQRPPTARMQPPTAVVLASARTGCPAFLFPSARADCSVTRSDDTRSHFHLYESFIVHVSYNMMRLI